MKIKKNWQNKRKEKKKKRKSIIFVVYVCVGGLFCFSGLFFWFFLVTYQHDVTDGFNGHDYTGYDMLYIFSFSFYYHQQQKHKKWTI